MSSLPILSLVVCAFAAVLLWAAQGSRRRSGSAAPVPAERESRFGSGGRSGATRVAPPPQRPGASSSHRLSCPERWRAADGANAAPAAAPGGDQAA